MTNKTYTLNYHDKKSNDLICYTKIDRKKAIQLHQYPKLLPSHFSISSKLIPFRSAKLST